MSSREESERPKAVTVIGRLWIVLAALSLFRSLVNLILWSVLQPAMPSIFNLAVTQQPQTQFLEPLLRHFTLWETARALFAVAAGVSAYFFLRLRPWARVAIQAISWLVLLYAACFSIFWASVWGSTFARAVATGSLSTHAEAPMGFLFGIAISMAVVAGSAVVLGFLRSRRVKAAFATAAKATAGRSISDA